MALAAPDPRASLSLTESNRYPLELQASHATGGSSAREAREQTLQPQAGSGGGALSPTRSSRSFDVEKRKSAWLCVLGSFFFMIPSYGFMQSAGTVQGYLQLNQLSDYSPRDVGWITGMYTFLALFLGIQTGPLMDLYGARRLAPIAAALTIPMFFILAECTEYWHFMLCLGVLGGIGGATTSTVAVAVVGKLFVRYKGLAMGLALAGASIGGLMFPLMLRSVFPVWGYQWTMRAVGFVVTGVMVPGIICLFPFPTLIGEVAQVGSRDGAVVSGEGAAPAKKAAINFSAFRSPPFSFVTGALFLLEFAIFGITGILPTLVSWSGFPPDTGYIIVAVTNGVACFGRIIPGLIGDRVGHFNVLILMIILTTICTAVTLVPFGSTHIEALYVFSALWGLGSGSFLSLTPVCLGKTCEPKDYGRFYGTMNFVVSFALLITVPIGGQMLESMGAMALSGLYVAVVFMGGVSTFAARSLLVGTWFGFSARI